MAILEFLGGLENDARPKISHVGQIARLREFAARYATPTPFKVGDLVTPRADAPLRGRGHPSVVVEVEPEPWADFVCESPGQMSYGAKHDIRVAHMDGNEQPVMHWCESVYYEAYTSAHEALAGKEAECGA